MQKYFKFSNVLLFFLTLAVLWLIGEVTYQGLVDDANFLQNSDVGYVTLATKFGRFPIVVDDTVTGDAGTKITFNIINPVTIHFKEAGISLIVNGTLEKKSVDLSPGLNRVEFDVSPMDRGETFQMYIDLDKIYQR